MKKIVFLLFFICLLMTPALADYTVDGVSVTAEVSPSGVSQVSATYQLSFDSPTTEVAIPLPEERVSKVSVNDFRSSLEETSDGPVVIVKRRSGFLGSTTFLVHYTVAFTDEGGEEEDSFSLGLLSSRWAKEIGSCSFQVLMPSAFDVEPEITSGYHGLLSASDTGLAVTETSFGGAVSALMAYDSLSASLTLPEGYFRVRRANMPVMSVNALTLSMLAVWLLLVIYWRATIWFPRSSGAPRQLVPEGILSCQLPMILDGSTCDVAIMIMEWATLGYLSISRSSKGVLLLTRTMEMGSERTPAEQSLFHGIFGKKLRVAATPGRFSVVSRRFRAASRRSLYRLILDRNGGNPILVQIPSRILMAIAVGAVAAGFLPEGAGFIVLAVFAGIAGFVFSVYLHNAVSRYAALRDFDRVSLLCLAITILLVPLSRISGTLPELFAGLGACLFSAIATSSGPRRSKRGVEALAQAKGLRTYYREASWNTLQYHQSRNRRYFEQTYPRAAALRADRQFAQRFERLPIAVPDWLDLPSPATRSAAALRRDLSSFLRQLREAFR